MRAVVGRRSATRGRYQGDELDQGEEDVLYLDRLQLSCSVLPSAYVDRAALQLDYTHYLVCIFILFHISSIVLNYNSGTESPNYQYPQAKSLQIRLLITLAGVHSRAFLPVTVSTTR